jgi:drug/metabolite transporter (DMT)-like permease
LPTATEVPAATANHQTRALIMVLCCTFIGAAAQILLKKGSVTLGVHPSMLDTLIGIFTTKLLFIGYAMYGMSAVLLVMALRLGELSLLYPVFTLTYVWVMLLSHFFFQESINPLKLIGVAVIMCGVAVIGKASRP